METIRLTLVRSGSEEVTIKEQVNIEEGNNYHSDLSKSLRKAQSDFNTALTEIIDQEKKRQEGEEITKKAKKMKKC